MKVTLGKEGLKNTCQAEFREETECAYCKGTARIGLVVQEKKLPKPGKQPQAFVCHLHENEGKGGYWPYDLCAVAVYFCKECFEATALWNQA